MFHSFVSVLTASEMTSSMTSRHSDAAVDESAAVAESVVSNAAADATDEYRY